MNEKAFERFFKTFNPGYANKEKRNLFCWYKNTQHQPKWNITQQALNPVTLIKKDSSIGIFL